MNLQDSDAFRQQLLGQQAELEALGETARAATQTVDLDQSSVGRLSRMDAMQGQQMALESARRREQELRAIQGALRRIDAGEFGRCSVCGEEIALKRLHADPKVTRCIGCADA
jgi:DnaK suppressor protein